jgi:hypothetical protein
MSAEESEAVVITQPMVADVEQVAVYLDEETPAPVEATADVVLWNVVAARFDAE